jgi:hypothetical protein
MLPPNTQPRPASCGTLLNVRARLALEIGAGVGFRTQTTTMIFQMRETESPRYAGARTRPMFLDSMPSRGR